MDYFEYILDLNEQRRHEDEPDQDEWSDALEIMEVILRITAATENAVRKIVEIERSF